MMKVEKEVWPDFLQFEEAHFKSQMDVFPEGSICAVVKERIVGIGTVQIVKWLDVVGGENWTWYSATDNGYISGTHNPSGDTLYGVSLSVLPVYQGSVAPVIIEYYARLVVKRNLMQAVVEARLPGFAAALKKNRRLTAEWYARGGEASSDLGLYTKLGMELVVVIPNYVQDPDSLNYAAIMCWRNPAYVPG